MEITVNLTPSDWKAYIRFLVESAASRSKPTWPVTLVMTIVFIIIGFLYTELFGDIHWPTFWVTSILALLAFIEYRIKVKLRAAQLNPTDGGMLKGCWKYTFNTKSLEIEGSGFKTSISWSCVREVLETAELIILVLDNTSAYLIPKRDVADAENLLNYIKEIHTQVQRALIM